MSLIVGKSPIDNLYYVVMNGNIYPLSEDAAWKLADTLLALLMDEEPPDLVGGLDNAGPGPKDKVN